MKTISSLILAGAGLGVAATASAQITNTSDLILFVTDTANGASFVQDLGTLASSVGNTSTGNYNIGTNTIGTITNPVLGSGVLNGSGIDTSLATFLTTNGGGNGTNFVYGVLGVPASGSGAQGGSVEVTTMDASAAQVLADEGTLNYNATVMFTNGATNGAVGTDVGGKLAYLNAGGTPAYGYGTSGAGFQAASTLGNPNDYALGSTTYLWAVATGASQANFYASATGITVGTNGAITGFSTSTVPLPAAIWLLGSGLLGLAGISRRRAAA